MAIEITTEQITPQLAERYLAKAGKNRPVSRHVVAAYANDMSEGLWKTTGQGIQFNNRGELIDGQHRLAAVIKSGKTVEMVVIRGLQPDAMTAIDIGRKRQASNILAIDGWQNTAVAASIARMCLLYDLKNFSSAQINALSTEQVYSYAARNREKIERASSRAREMRKKIHAPQSVTGTAYKLFSDIDAEACERFFYALTEAQTNGPGDPRLALMRRLSSIHVDRTRANQYMLLDLFIRAWNAWREDKQMDRLPLITAPDWRKAV